MDALSTPATFGSVRLAIVGGGLSAATLAIQLTRRTRVPVAITIIEPREHLGRGLAYSATDPDHRLNAPLEVQSLDPEQPDELRQWFEKSGLLESDSECQARGGQVFLRRSELGAYINQRLEQLLGGSPGGSALRHVRDVAISATVCNGIYTVRTARTGNIEADVLVVATGNPPPSLRPPFLPEHSSHPRIISNPLEPGCLDRIPLDARVLVVGGGLTALDILSTMVRRSHHGGILVVSRRGLRPRSQPPHVLGLVPAESTKSVPGAAAAPIPEFMKDAEQSVRGWTRAIREEIAKTVQAGRSWHEPMDQVRDVVWQLWPLLPLREKQRFLRRMRVFYDVHRFRAPPMNDEMVRNAEREGRVQFEAAALAGVHASQDSPTIRVNLLHVAAQEPTSEEFDYVVNCTGLDAGTAWKSNPFLRATVESGLLRVHGTGMGLDVGSNCEALDRSGLLQSTLRVIGPPTAGVFGDPLGIPFISGQVRRMLPDLMSTLERIDKVPELA